MPHRYLTALVQTTCRALNWPLDKATSSYNATEVRGDRRAEIARLRAQIRLSFDKELRFMKWYGLADGARVVEFGCGPGGAAAEFAAALPASGVPGGGW